MPIPSSPRVHYEKHTLEEVVCQLRFPPVLRIGAELPAGFQERVRREYPLYGERSEPSIGIPPGSGLPADIVAKFVPAIAAYEFGSEDEKWKLTLTRDFLALTCSDYTRWEVFIARLGRALDALVQEYEPAFYLRAGLRYRNIIKRTSLGLDGVPWSEMLKPYAIGELATPMSDEVDRIARETIIRLDKHSGRVRVLQGTVREKANSELCFLIDCDYFTDSNTGVSDAIGVLGYFNQQSGNLFRWYIQPRLHEAMVPRSL